MYPTLPDVAVKIETLEGITTELAEVEDRLVKAHGIPRRAFQRELARRICSGEVPLSRDVERWEMLYAALLDWASNGAELGSAVNAKPPDSTTNATEGAAAGGPPAHSPTFDYIRRTVCSKNCGPTKISKFVCSCPGPSGSRLRCKKFGLYPKSS